MLSIKIRMAKKTPAPRRILVTTTYRVFQDQRDALQQAAIKRREEKGGRGRPDASALLRDILDKAGVKR